MMGAVARGVRAGGRHTLGVIPAALVGLEVADEDADELVVTTTCASARAAWTPRADAFLALPGGLGTLEELLEVWVAGTLGMHAKPVVVLDPDRRLRRAARPGRQAARAGVRPAGRRGLRGLDVDGRRGARRDRERARPLPAVPDAAEVGEELLEAEP